MISVQNITKTFKDLKAINNLTLEISDGEIYGFKYVNGHPKNTKEDNKRYKERFGFTSLQKNVGKEVIWIHASSVGECIV